MDSASAGHTSQGTEAVTGQVGRAAGGEAQGGDAALQSLRAAAAEHQVPNKDVLARRVPTWPRCGTRKPGREAPRGRARPGQLPASHPKR